MKFNPLTAGLLFPLSLFQASLAGELAWQGKDGPPQECDPQFRIEGDKGCFSVEDGILVMDTRPNKSAWYSIKWKVDPKKGYAVEFEAASEAGAGTACVYLCDGESAFALFLWEGKHLAWKKQGKNEYLPLNVKDFHLYRIERQGEDFVVKVDGNPMITARAMPLTSADEVVLRFGDMTEGGGMMQMRSLRVEGLLDEKLGAVKPAAGETQVHSQTAWLRWTLDGAKDFANRISAPIVWPDGCDALALTVTYLADAPGQARFQIECAAAEQTASVALVASGLGSVSTRSDDYRTEQFFIRIPKTTRAIRMGWEADPATVPFQLRSSELRPVRIIASNANYEKLSPCCKGHPVAQEFPVNPNLPLAGVHVPLVRRLELTQLHDELVGTLQVAGRNVATATLDARNLPYLADGDAVFLFDNPVTASGSVRFGLATDLGDAYYSIAHRLSWSNPYPAGAYSWKDKQEPDWDMVFTAFTGVPATQ